MCAWFITRVNTWYSKALYYLFVFSMVVPFQMLMFTLSATADRLKLSSPYTICIIYLGFGAGLAVFMFCGFMKSIPIEIESRSEIWSEIESTILNSFFYDEIGNEIESMTSTEIVFAF